MTCHFTASLFLACATCRGDAGSTSSLAQDGAIGFMLVLLAAVLGTFITVMFSFARKQRLAQQAPGVI